MTESGMLEKFVQVAGNDVEELAEKQRKCEAILQNHKEVRELRSPKPPRIKFSQEPTSRFTALSAAPGVMGIYRHLRRLPAEMPVPKPSELPTNRSVVPAI